MNRTNIIDDLTLVPLPEWWQNPVVWLVGTAVLGVVGWWLFRWWRQPRPVAAPREDGVPAPIPAEEALRRLEALKRRLPEIKDYDLAIEASDILRGFIEGQHQLPIRYQTTLEFLQVAAGSPAISSGQRETLAQFLGYCDLGKFARQSASLAEMQQTVETAIRFVQSSVPVAVGGVA